MSDLGNKQVFSNNLKKYMELNNVTQTDICTFLKFKASTFSDWVNAKTYPRIDKIEMLANYFGINKSDLIEDKELEKAEEKIKELSDENKIFFSKFDKLNDNAKKQVLKIIETFEDETQD